ncbi:MAG: acetyl esterase [Salinirussus sp.]|jgi:acetyl esterase
MGCLCWVSVRLRETFAALSAATHHAPPVAPVAGGDRVNPKPVLAGGMADRPDPAAQEVIEMSEAVPVPPSNGLSAESARQRLEDIMGDLPAEEVANTEEYSIAGPEATDRDLPLRVYEPDVEPPYPVLVYYHGGGFIAGSLDTHDNICAALTNRAGCLTVSVDYRLSPEHPFPAGLEDAYRAVEWATAFGEKLNGDPDRVAVAGDSAGGNLAAAVSLLARDQGGPDLTYQGLIYPGTASPVLHDIPSHEENAEGYFLETETVEFYYENYVQSPAHVRNAYASPLLADDLSGLAPATVITAGFDPIRDEGVRYADRLAEDGVETEHLHYEEMIHAFVSLPTAVPQGEDALDELGGHLAEAFGTA